MNECEGLLAQAHREATDHRICAGDSVAEAKLRPQEGQVSAAENAVIACIEYNDKKRTQRAGSSDSNDAP